MKEIEAKKGPWLITYTGRKVYPLAFSEKDIHILDIAHSLANKCRYNGHVSPFYSVAQHCVLMAESKLPGMPRWKLMHDAAEAYLPDVVCGFKPLLPVLVETEDRILEVIAKALDLPPLAGEILDDVKIGDVVIRYWEGRALMQDAEDVEWARGVSPPEVKVKIEYWDPSYAEDRFINCYRKLFGYTNKRN